MREQYWPVGYLREDRGYRLAARASIALRLLDHFAIIAAKETGEDSAGRQAFELVKPSDFVHRAFALAEDFIAKAEQLGEIEKVNPYSTARSIGRLQGIRRESEDDRQLDRDLT